VRTVREIHARIETLKAAMREAREALRIADKAREAAEDDLDAIDAGRRPG
jgi:predicted RNase H-like HicB family nuclease